MRNIISTLGSNWPNSAQHHLNAGLKLAQHRKIISTSDVVLSNIIKTWGSNWPNTEQHYLNIGSYTEQHHFKIGPRLDLLSFLVAKQR